jgi:uncharacterized membrane protein
MPPTPLAAIQLSAAVAALVLGPVALWARRGRQQRPRLHRAVHAAWVASLVATAAMALFLRDTHLLGRLGLDGPARARLSTMAGQIVSHTPVFVWGVLAALIVLGLSQARERRVSLARATVLPFAMVALSLWGTASLFASGPHLPLVLASWLAAALATFLPVMRLPAPLGTRFDAASNGFTLPASWMPMLLIVGVFALRYATNVALAMQPALSGDATFAAGIAAVSGLFTGGFGGRAARLWLLAQRRHAPRLPAPNIA